jgi:hypothetical protein
VGRWDVPTFVSHLGNKSRVVTWLLGVIQVSPTLPTIPVQPATGWDDGNRTPGEGRNAEHNPLDQTEAFLCPKWVAHRFRETSVGMSPPFSRKNGLLRWVADSNLNQYGFAQADFYRA